MTSKRLRSTFPAVSGGGGGVTTIPAFSDDFFLRIETTDSNAEPTDNTTFLLRAGYADTNDAQTETLQLGFPAGNFGDANEVPSDAKTFTLRCWLSGSAGGTNPANANGINDGVLATVQTAVAGAATVTLTSALGSNVPSGITLTSVIYRGWFNSVNTLATSTGALIMQSLTALFSDITMLSNAALNTTVNRLDGSFTFDLLAAGINTLAKLQSSQMLHRTTDAVPGVTPHVLTVDAGCCEISGAFV